MGASFSVNKYSIDKLIEIISSVSLASVEDIKQKHHSIYFKEYFEHVNAKTIIVEKEYIDKDYLEDFASYYVRCFKDYKRKCSRFHFFSKNFDKTKFQKLLEGDESELNITDLQKTYLGFIVIKPLPNTVIGRTCLKTYECEDYRFFPIIRKYKANLYGIQLEIDTIAFQEQDSVVSACATSALWSLFHGTGKLFQHQIYSPADITKKASEYLPAGSLETRIFPNKGLSIEQMAYTIRSLNLEPYLVNPTNQFVLQSTIYAYTKGKIPSLMGVSLYDINQNMFLGKHAITVIGYNLVDKYITTVTKSKINLTSSRIEKFYVHDDQVGPYARVILDNKKYKFKLGSKIIETYSLKTFWPDTNKNIGNIRAIPSIILTPLYHKIRIPYITILETIIYFNSFIEFLKKNSFLIMPSNIEWDIYLSTINDFKTEVLENNYQTNNDLSKILTKSLPHFVWRSSAKLENKLIFDLLFDATDIEQGNYFLTALEYDKSVCDRIHYYSKNKIIFDEYKFTPAKSIIKWFNSN